MNLIISDRAEEDIALALAYLMDVNIPAAEKLAGEIERRIISLGEFPHSGSPRDDLQAGLRCVIVRTLLVFYTTGRKGVTIPRGIDSRMDIEAEFRR